MAQHGTGRSRPHPHVVLALTVAVILSNAGGNSFLRVGLSSAGAIVTLSPLPYIEAFTRVWVLLGVVLLAANFILYLALLSWADLSYVLPVTSPSYVLAALVGAFALHEPVSLAHWIGIALILVGVIIVGRTRPLTPGSGLK